ncbi:pUP60L [African swine fever virus]|uniref:Protein MGF 360-5L n=1 Tax=African swine fever virus (strain Badajoz 1971 Vero-adapted) TaxID=10498 RepID=3605L_ASFB7|nr:pUP60L [African swine fever virus]Q65133.1 RecName: Full=Protein MGF 360-5L [African swine fever virus BA71V]AAA65248.1 pUP60L [African swine fever virus]prf//2113434N UP60L gene [African swine fever virus]
MNSLQVLTKKVLIENKAFSEYHEDDIFILQQLGLWWTQSPGILIKLQGRSGKRINIPERS